MKVPSAPPSHADDLTDSSDGGLLPSGFLLPDEDEPSGPQTRISPLRVLLALVVIAGLVVGGIYWARDRDESAAARQVIAAQGAAWFGPYVDATLTPSLAFQDPSLNPARQVVLGFIVGDKESGCDPSWGSYYSLSGAASALNLDRRIAQLQDQGSSALVSFGGQANRDLAISCPNVEKLTKAYQSVVDRYSLTTIDLDVEGRQLADKPSIIRRAQAIAALQKKAKAAKTPLNVWLTLPVEPNGLQSDALSVISQMQKAGVELAGVNIMAMDFTAAPNGMYPAITSALYETHRQLMQLSRSTTAASDAQTWHRIGVTVMIGQNDVDGQILSVTDARQVEGFAKARHLGRVSMWSLNRDSQCGSQFARVGVHSDTCSGTSQTKLEFSQIFGALSGTVPTVEPSAVPTRGSGTVVDNPATAPFPIWNPAASYPSDYKVVRQGFVYQAKYYNTGIDPAAASADPNQTPWLIVGPVLPTDKAPALPTLAPGTYPTWNPATAYRSGMKVLRSGLPYQAKYYTLGDDPTAVLTNPAGSPWKALYTIPGEPVAAG